MAVIEGPGDHAWSQATREQMIALDAAVDDTAKQFEQDDDHAGAETVRLLGGIFVHAVGAVCSALADVAMSIREHPHER